jgi:hypothetical protein
MPCLQRTERIGRVTNDKDVFVDELDILSSFLGDLQESIDGD